MTIKEAMAAGVKFVRKPAWNPTARLELPARLPNGMHGPWCVLHDVGTMTDILWYEADDGRADWETCES